MAILEVGGHLPILKSLILREIGWCTLVFICKGIIHWVYLNIHINGLIITIFILFYVVRAAHHVLTLVLLILSGALISLVHKLFLGCIRILVGGCIKLPQMSVAPMSTSCSSRIKNIMAIDAQIFVGSSELICICLITTPGIVSHSAANFCWFQIATLAYDVLGIISEIVTRSTNFLPWRRSTFQNVVLIHRLRL